MWSSHSYSTWFNCDVFFHRLYMKTISLCNGGLRFTKVTQADILWLWDVWQWWKLLVKKIQTRCVHFTANRAPSSPHSGQGGAGDQGGDRQFDDEGGAGRSADLGRNWRPGWSRWIGWPGWRWKPGRSHWISQAAMAEQKTSTAAQAEQKSLSSRSIVVMARSSLMKHWSFSAKWFSKGFISRGIICSNYHLAA